MPNLPSLATIFVIIAKQPVSGITKTRLCPPLSPIEAADLYEALLRDTIALAASLPDADLAVAITPAESLPYFKTITPRGTLLLPVEGVDIGEVQIRALQVVFKGGYRKMLAMIADGPSVPPEYLLQAAALLDDVDVVYGPGHDGGYYLVGMKEPHPELFKQVSWSTDQVMTQALTLAFAAGLNTALTPTWYDLDLPGDLPRLLDDLQRLPVERLAFTRRLFANNPQMKKKITKNSIE